jgi:hypothetical protein
MLVRIWGKKELSHTAGGNVKLVQPLWKTIWRLLKKLNIRSGNIIPRDILEGI